MRNQKLRTSKQFFNMPCSFNLVDSRDLVICFYVLVFFSPSLAISETSEKSQSCTCFLLPLVLDNDILSEGIWNVPFHNAKHIEAELYVRIQHNFGSLINLQGSEESIICLSMGEQQESESRR